MSQEVSERAATSSAPEDLFAELFTQVFGLEKTLLLVPQYPTKDIYDGSRFVDYALRTRDQRVAFEIDGLTWHVPDATSVAKYEDDLLKQNSLVHSGWRVFHWTDRQIAREPERVKEQLALFLERVAGLLSFDDFLPRQTGEVVELRAHQDNALLALERMRGAGKSIALLDHATGAGKTITAIADARRLGGRTLWLVHTRNLVAQTHKEFERLWPEVEAGRYYGGAHETDAYNLVGSIQSFADRQAFTEGSLQVLCACDILNEGWDCPAVEVLLMARPTLSRAIYLQQLGRGTRKAPGKECLIAFVFVDNASRYNQSLSLHRVLGQSRYRHGGLVLASEDLLDAEKQALARGVRPTTVLEIGLWAKEYQQIDIFNWQQEVSNMISLPDLERELVVGEGRVRAAIERDQVKPDHTLQLGERTYFYFDRARVEEIRQVIGAPKVEDHTIRDRFMQFIEDMDTTMSYKPVMLLALLDTVGEDGRAKLNEVVQQFRRFYRSAVRLDSLSNGQAPAGSQWLS